MSSWAKAHSRSATQVMGIVLRLVATSVVLIVAILARVRAALLMHMGMVVVPWNSVRVCIIRIAARMVTTRSGESTFRLVIVVMLVWWMVMLH